LTPDHAGNVVGVDPHKRTLTATVVDARGGILASEHFRVSGEGHRAPEAWARQFGPIVRWGIEGAAAWGRHTAIFLARRGHDVRDVCPNRTGRQDRARQRGKSDELDSERIARETLAHPLLPRAFKRAGEEAGPDEQAELLAVWWQARCALMKRRQHLLSEAEARLHELPLVLIERLPDTKAVRPRLRALKHATYRRRLDPPSTLRVRLLSDYRDQIAKLDREEKAIRHEQRGRGTSAWPRTEESRRARRHGCIAREMSKPNRATRTAAGALLLFYGPRLLVRHERTRQVASHGSESNGDDVGAGQCAK
jgi:hypothetical protein